jgi:hypothetical protein
MALIEEVEGRVNAERQNPELIRWIQRRMTGDDGCMDGVVRETVFLVLLDVIDGPKIQRILGR